MASSPVLGAVLLGPHVADIHGLPTTALALSVEGRLEVGHRGRTHRATAFALGSDVPHTGAGAGAHVIVSLDDLHPLGRALSAAHPSVYGDPPWARRLCRVVRRHAFELERPGVLLPLLEEGLRQAATREDWRAPQLDDRVAQAIEAIEAAVVRGVRTPRPLVGGISAPHLRALFKRDLGRTISQHTRQRRLLVAMGRVGRGASATRAAHDAGFADAAHLSRTVRLAYGTTLRALGRGHTRVSPSR